MSTNSSRPFPKDSSDSGRYLPGWIISLLLHSAMFGVMVARTDRRGAPDGSAEAFRDVGLVSRELLASAARDDATSVDADSSGADAGGADESVVGGISPPKPVSDPLLIKPAVEPPAALPLQLPKAATLGSGPAVPTGLPQSAIAGGSPPGAKKGRIRGLPGSGGEGAQGTGMGPRFGRSDGTSFFQVAAQGDRFCYVVDSSGSMDDNNAIGVARSELMASIERLDPGKQFQVLFYDSVLHPMVKGRQDVFFATDINRTFARQFINNQQPSGGTLHYPALKTALATGPDVIFFLSDGDEPELTYRELRELKGLNRHNSQIHVIEFGLGPKSGPLNWLEQIAKDHQGTYRYRDVRTFRK